MKIPENYLPVMPYLILDNASDFLTYAKSVFGAKEQLIIPAEDGNGVMHGEIKIHDAVVMFANSTPQWKEKTAGMFLFVDDVNRVYNAAVEQGGTSLQAPEKKEYGYSAGFEDPFGNQWWITQG